MNREFGVRALPVLGVLALLCLAAAAPPPGVGPAAPSQYFSGCDLLLESGGGESAYSFPADQGITQPLPAGITAASCSLRTDIVGSQNETKLLRVTLREWDPLTLAPAPNTIALRTLYFDLSRTSLGVPRIPIAPPFVARSVEGVAEPSRVTAAVEFEAGSFSVGTFDAHYDPASASDMPDARVIGPGGVRGPLPGAHPVFAHAVCGGDDDLQQLRVAQSVVRQDLLLSASPAELVQRFRVPEPVELRWVELALGVPTVQTAVPAMVGIVDGGSLATPAQLMPPPLVEAAYYHYYNTQPQWASPFDFDHTIVLQPFHDYWIWVRYAQGHAFFARQATGSEGPDFTANIGALYTRADSGDPWSQQSSQALDFRIVGRPLSSVGVAPPQRADGFALRIAPNPARELSEVRWSGGVGPVRLEVLDARGRRVAAGEGGAAGTWRMAPAAGGGALLPAGVYFVHARDTAGDHAVERVVIVR
jgi:hypothetical protein